jgi:hypothetical protein
MRFGEAPQRPVIKALRPEPGKPLIRQTTHTHVDHIGSAFEFEKRLVHPIDVAEPPKPAPDSLDASGLPDRLHQQFLNAGNPPLWPPLIDALPPRRVGPNTLHPRREL